MNLQDLEIGKEYTLTKSDSVNKAIFLSHDRTGMNRKIGYFIFSERGYTIPKDNFPFFNIVDDIHVFAIWQHEIDSNNISICNHNNNSVCVKCADYPLI